ncbi:hypothetical protein M427DRAFT_105584, partial [Gonapodya prolifera JEL478]
LATCTGTLTLVWSLSSCSISARLGRPSGGIHRANILGVAFCHAHLGMYLATSDAVGKIVVWNVRQQASERVSDRTGAVYDVKFSQDGERLFSCADDGVILVWNWRKGMNTFSPRWLYSL